MAWKLGLIIFVILDLTIIGAYFGYVYYKRRKLREELIEYGHITENSGAFQQPEMRSSSISYKR